MKKISLIGVALLGSATISFAQNTATLNQVGNQQTGTATQTGTGLMSNIQQTTASGITNVGNYANTTQESGGYGSTNNQANINQLGTKSGFANIGQQGSGQKATINQKNNNGGNGTPSTAANGPGTVQDANNVPNPAGINAVTGNGGNYANAFQRGNNETVTINQNDNSTSNYTDSRQDSFGGPNTATVNQNGGTLGGSSGNKTTINQFGDNNTLSVSQSNNSSNNKANVRQGYSTAVGGPSSFNATATIEQNGGMDGASSENEATITQIYSGFNTATIRQNNNSTLNKATVLQDGGTGSTATINQVNDAHEDKATITQSASNNTATINQEGPTASGFSTGRNVAEITQKPGDNSGIGNTALINQKLISEDNQAYILQTGVGGMATINQTGSSADNLADIKQKGYNNAATIDQSNAYDPVEGAATIGSARGNKATITQDLVTYAGSGNIAHIKQGDPSGVSSDDNVASIVQEYSNNQARLQQTGNRNHADIYQTGDHNIVRNGAGVAGSFALQQGNDNILHISQNSGGAAPYTPNTANVSQIGNSNVASITQSSN